MRREIERVAAPLIALVSAGAGISACTGSDDDGAEQIPACQVLWATQAVAPDTYDVYLIEMPLEMWSPEGIRAFSIEEGVYGMFYDDFNETGAQPTWSQRLVTPTGTFTLTSSLAAPAPGGTINLTDDGLQQYYDLSDDEEVGSVVLGSGGAGDFFGVWSPEGSGSPDPGSGSIAITVGTSSLSLGQYVSYAQCFGPDGNSATAAAASTTRAHPLPRFPQR